MRFMIILFFILYENDSFEFLLYKTAYKLFIPVLLLLKFTSANSQHENINSKGDFVLKTGFKRSFF